MLTAKDSWKLVAYLLMLTFKWLFNLPTIEITGNFHSHMKLRWLDCSEKEERRLSDLAQSNQPLGWERWKTRARIQLLGFDCWMKLAKDTKLVIKMPCVVEELIATFSAYTSCQSTWKLSRLSSRKYWASHGDCRQVKHPTGKHRRWTSRRIRNASVLAAGSDRFLRTAMAFLTSLRAKIWSSSTFPVRKAVKPLTQRDSPNKSARLSPMSENCSSSISLIRRTEVKRMEYRIR